LAVAALLLGSSGSVLANEKLLNEIEKAEKDLAKGESEKAVERLGKFAEKNPSGDAYIALAEIQTRAGAMGGGGVQAAAASAEQAVRHAQGPADRAHALAGQARVALLGGGTSAQALQHAQAAVQAHEDALSLHALTLAQVRVQNYAAALQSAERAVAAAPNAPEAQAARGAALLGNGRSAEAVEAFRKALAAQPGMTEAQVGLTAALSRAGKHADAVAAGRAATAANTASAEAYATLGLAILREAPEDPTHHNDAIAEAQQGKFLNDRSVVAQLAVGEIFNARGDLQNAQRAFEAALQVDPGFVPARAGLIQIKVRKQDFDGALADADALVQETPQSAQAHLQRGRILVRANRWADALSALEKAVELGSGLAEAHALLGTSYQYNRRTEDAVSAYHRATELDPGNDQYRTVYGLFLGMTGQHAQGIAELRKVTGKPDYKSADAWVNLGWIYRNARPRQATESVEAYSRALEIDPDNAQAALGLGWAYSYVQPRRWAEAERAFLKAAQLDEALAGEAYSGIGWVKFFTQDIEGALEYLEKARDQGRFDRRLAANIERVQTNQQAQVIIDAYQRMELGMSYAQVQELMGSPGEETEREGNSVTYQWHNPDDTYVVAVFDADKLVDKLHTGLEDWEPPADGEAAEGESGEPGAAGEPAPEPEQAEEDPA
jgi:tetratricopeptide (TPR) repeat protein